MLIDVEIERVIELTGLKVRGLQARCYAHVSKPILDNGQPKRYALLGQFPQHGITYLGEINPKTLEFFQYSEIPVFYERSSNRVIKKLRVSNEQLLRLKTIEEVLSIEGIKVASEGTPSN